MQNVRLTGMKERVKASYMGTEIEFEDLKVEKSERVRVGQECESRKIQTCTLLLG